MSNQAIHDQVVAILRGDEQQLKAELLGYMNHLYDSITPEQLVKRFLAGRIEHNDDLEKLNELGELREEIYDALIYLAMHIAKNSLSSHD